MGHMFMALGHFGGSESCASVSSSSRACPIGPGLASRPWRSRILTIVLVKILTP